MTPQSKQFILNNSDQMTMSEMARSLGLKYIQVYDYCKYKQIETKKSNRGRPRTIKYIRPKSKLFDIDEFAKKYAV